MEKLLQIIINGMSIGCIYTLAGLGFMLIHNTVGTVNFAQGELIMVGAYIGYTAITVLKVPLIFGILITLTSMIIIGYLFQLIAYYPLRNKPIISSIICMIGLGIAIKNVALNIWGAIPKSIPYFLGTQEIRIGKIVLSTQHLLIILFTFVLLALLWLFFSKTRLGKKMEATAQSPIVARLMGINTKQMIALTFILSAILAGIAGIFLLPIFFVEPNSGSYLVLKLFVAVVIGGFGSIPGSIFGGLILGLSETMIAAYISSLYKDVFTFLMLIGILLLRPQGLFGEKILEKI